MSFDRAVSYYDRTRSLHAGTMERVAAALVAELVGHQPSLEIGVGTGRMAIPIHRGGIAMIGVDLSEPMLRVLVEKSEGALRFPLTLGDATALPFRENSMGSAIAIHVLHLIPNWRDAVCELLRVVRPGGRLAVEIGDSFAPGPFREIARRFAARAGLPPKHRGVNTARETDEALAEAGARGRALGTIVEERTSTYSHTISSLEDGLYSFTWDASEHARRRAGADTREWARERWGDLDQNYSFELRVDIRIYELP